MNTSSRGDTAHQSKSGQSRSGGRSQSNNQGHNRSRRRDRGGSGRGGHSAHSGAQKNVVRPTSKGSPAIVLKQNLVVHSCTSSSFSGLESYVLDLVTWQHQKRRAVLLFCREGTPLHRMAVEKGVPVYTIGPKDKSGPRLWASLRKFWAEKLKVGNVTLHMHAGGEPWYHLPWLWKTKSILQYHIWINHKKNDPLHRVLFSAIGEVWTSSESARNHLLKLLPVRPERLRVVPYGRDIETMSLAPRSVWRRDVRRALNIGERDTLILSVARLEPLKGVRELFEAFLKIESQFPHAHLAIVGAPSPHDESAERLAHELKIKWTALPESLKARIHLPGHVSPVLPFFAAADMYVVASHEECFSLAMIDAAAFGLPIIGTRSGGTPSLVHHDETGLLVEPKSVDALADGLTKLLKHPRMARLFGDEGKKRSNKFDREQIYQSMLQHYAARAVPVVALPHSAAK